MTEFEKLLLNWAISIIAFFLSYAIGKKNGKKEEKNRNLEKSMELLFEKNKIHHNISNTPVDKLQYRD